MPSTRASDGLLTDRDLFSPLVKHGGRSACGDPLRFLRLRASRLWEFASPEGRNAGDKIAGATR